VSTEKANQQALMHRSSVLLTGYLPSVFHLLPIIGGISIFVNNPFIKMFPYLDGSQ
jgi:hypothetical protein